MRFLQRENDHAQHVNAAFNDNRFANDRFRSTSHMPNKQKKKRTVSKNKVFPG